MTIYQLSDFYKSKLASFRKNPNAVISAGWSNDGFELYINSFGDAYWAYLIVECELPLVVLNPKNYSPSCSREGVEGERWFANRLRYFVADILARKGYSHQAVLWACHNLLTDEGEVIPTATVQKRQRTRRRRFGAGETPAATVSTETVKASNWFAPVEV